MVRFSITELVGVTVVFKSGEVHIVITFTGIFTAGLNSTTQVKMEEDPAIIIPAGAVTITEVGTGTEEKQDRKRSEEYIMEEKKVTIDFHNSCSINHHISYPSLACVDSSIRCP